MCRYLALRGEPLTDPRAFVGRQVELLLLGGVLMLCGLSCGSTLRQRRSSVPRSPPISGRIASWWRGGRPALSLDPAAIVDQDRLVEGVWRPGRSRHHEERGLKVGAVLPRER